MTIKIKAPVIWVYEADLTGFLSVRCNEQEKKYRIVSESNWRKLMKLVKETDEHTHADPSEVCALCDALEALKEKGK